MIEPTSPCPDAATTIFNLPDYRVTDTEVLGFGQRRIHVVATAEAGCPSCGVISGRVHSRRAQRLRDIPIAGPVEVLWAKRRFFCEEHLCPRQSPAKLARDALLARYRLVTLIRTAVPTGVSRAAHERELASQVMLRLQDVIGRHWPCSQGRSPRAGSC